MTQGLKAGGTPPLGFMHEGERIVEHPRERATMKRIRELRAQGLSLRAIVDDLNANKEQFPPRGEKHHLNTIARALRESERYDRLRIRCLTDRAENLLRKVQHEFL